MLINNFICLQVRWKTYAGIVERKAIGFCWRFTQQKYVGIFSMYPQKLRKRSIPYGLMLNDLVRVSYGIHLMLVFPLVFYSLRLNLDGLVFPHAIPLIFDNRRFFSVTIALMGFIYMGANFVPSIWDAFQFTGATATVAVGYIFPAAVALR